MQVAGGRHGDRAVGRALRDVADIAEPGAAVDGDAAGAVGQLGLGVRRLATCMCMKLKEVLASSLSTLVSCGTIAIIAPFVTATI